ncbi:MAG TPA: glycoside hydrolase family 28 protein [Bryobacteraceae bacterium]|nr:glycoside hydrolase family 28 protein [Bryobacteraceae bacterium]
MTRRSFVGAAAAAPALLGADFEITAFGAVGDGKRNNRAAIQRAIDECSAGGGGVVRIPPGKFSSGTLRLKTGVALWLDHGAVLAASSDPAQYEARRPTDRLPPNSWECAFILAERIERAAILGYGAITGGGLSKPRERGEALQPFRPRLVSFEHCRNVRVEGVTLRDADRWTLHFYDCDSVQARGLYITAHYGIPNSDGIDVDGSRNVTISGCEMVTGDDCVVIKATNYLGEPRPCENVTVSNCTLSTKASGLKIGTETHADFSNIAFSNCTIFGSGQYRPDGVCLEAVDGTRVRGVSVSNISMRHVRTPIFVRVGSRHGSSRLEDAVISNIVAVDADMTSSITGIPSRAVENVSVSDVRIVMAGGAPASQADIKVPERESGYPSGRMFGPLPAYGFYVRHASAVDLRGVSVSCEQPDGRPVLVADDVEGLAVEGLRAEGPLRLRNVRRALVRGARGRVLVSGAQSEDIRLVAERQAPESEIVELAPEVRPETIRVVVP